MTLTVTALVPAHNEEDGLGDTLESLLAQTRPFDQIIVVDDGSTDCTREVALSYGVTVITPPTNLGSKAKAQNYGLEHVTTDVVLPVDADTVFAPDYVDLIMVPLETDPNVAVAAGCVLTRFDNTVWEKGRQVEYLFGFHWYRPVQQMANSPTVCSGCCTAFRVTYLRDFGGFPERTIVEDIDYTWSQQILGRRAVYVADAVAYAAEPTSATYLAKQLWRWKSGYFQNVRIHFRDLLRHKRMLAVWVVLQLLEIMLAPLIIVTLTMAYLFHGHALGAIAAWVLLGELAVMGPPVIYGCRKRGIAVWRAVTYWPAWWVLKCFNFYYDVKAIGTELIGVPLGLTKGLQVYEKGRADTVPV